MSWWPAKFRCRRCTYSQAPYCTKGPKAGEDVGTGGPRALDDWGKQGLGMCRALHGASFALTCRTVVMVGGQGTNLPPFGWWILSMDGVLIRKLEIPMSNVRGV